MDRRFNDSELALDFGGIRMSNETRIDVSDVERGANSPNIESASLKVHIKASIMVLESETFADQLMALTTAERRQARLKNDFRPN